MNWNNDVNNSYEIGIHIASPYVFFKDDLKYYTEITDFPEETYGFIYVITHTESKKYYIGKKILYNTTNVKLGKKELINLPVQRGKKPTTKQIIKESNWITYL